MRHLDEPASPPPESPVSPASRRGMLRGAIGLAGAAAALTAIRPTRAQTTATPVAAVGGPAGATPAAGSPFGGPIDVLNFALTLEHLDSTLYRQGVDRFANQDFVAAGFDPTVRTYLQRIVENEETHVSFLTDTIRGLGGQPVGAAQYNFPYNTVPEFLGLAVQIETVGLGAYTGSAQYLIDHADLLTAALTIHGVEARHLSYFRLLNGIVPFPNAVAAASPYVVGGVTLPHSGA
jgi:ferritin-like protein